MTRAYCYHCYRPQPACLCSSIKPVPNIPGVIILQHKAEVRHPRGSAVIADLSLQNSRRYVGEDFSSHAALNQILYSHQGRAYLVFPSPDATPLSQLQQRGTFARGDLEDCVFIFLDASWRKAKKIWHLSTNLQAIPSIELDMLAKSNYRIRKAPAPGLVSTLESIVGLLSRLESDLDKYQPMLQVFNQMIDQHIDHMGDEVYRQNYPR